MGFPNTGLSTFFVALHNFFKDFAVLFSSWSASFSRFQKRAFEILESLLLACTAARKCAFDIRISGIGE
jgi:hypothetical protein